MSLLELNSMLFKFLIISSFSVDDLIKIITAGKFDFENDIWNEISLKARELICQTLNLDPEKRITAEEALLSPWIVK